MRPYLRCCAALGALVVAAAAAPLAGDPVQVSAPFDSGKNRPRTDASGIACRAEAGVHHCLVVDDERQFVRTARLADGALTFTGDPIAIVRDSGPVDAGVVGRPPGIACGGGVAKPKDRFGNFDGEGAALAPDGTVYVVGSHGCSRTHDMFAPGSFLLSRLTPATDGAWTVRQSYRLAEALREAPGLRSFVGAGLDASNGLNIEGIAVLGGDLLVGLRAPVLNGAARIVRVPLAALFTEAPLPPIAPPITPPLGPDTGIRDLTVTRGGSLLVLAGPAQEQAAPYTLWLADAATGQARELAELAPVMTAIPACLKPEDRGKPGKAEGVTILEEGPASLRVLVLFDGLCDGEPRLYTLPLPR